MSKKLPRVQGLRKANVDKKPAKVEIGVKYADPAQARKSIEKIFRERHELLRKLAQ